VKPEQIVSAQIVLAAAGGARPGPQTRITSANIRQWKPSSEAVRRVSDELLKMGFTVGECIGNSFSITGPVRLFESRFKTRLRVPGKGGPRFAEDGYELAPKKIPLGLQGQIAAITFTSPPDFGPGADSFS